MLYRVILLSFAAVGGIGVAVYSLYVEAMIHAFPGYHAACDISSWSSCSKVFTSSYSRILVHWGIANPGGYLDLSLPHLAIPYFVFILSYPRMRRSGLRARQVYLVVGSLAVIFNIYLAMVLKFVLREFCVVCFANYILNAVVFICLVIDTRSACGPKVKKV
ncbi:Vitamin K epoxide reductase complex subunit 1-like protein 1 [Perkinsus olseni]|uniref:vitamin-K-epoxide reductase (warfarin-sensitive) n=2 Tax=Perkinsus olseni TaxID=32597 RepID=A0A7J6NP33_PEROL|nr:Vitamin K epoxide reductase complex subunit 1-like protein 1 [Perkinsus olseni]